MTRNNLKNTYAYVLFGVVAVYEAYHWLEKTKKTKKAQPRKFKENLMGQKPVPKKLRLSANTSGVFFGKTDSHTGYIGKPADEDGHILVLGATGSGKTSAVIRPTTSKWKGHTVQIFIKGDHLDFVNERRKEGRNVLVFEPELGEKNQLRYDPFLLLKRDENKFIDNVAKLACVLLPDKGDANDIWACNARTFLKAAMIYTYHLGAEFTEFLNVLFLDSMSALIAEIEDCGNEDARKYISKLSDMDKRQLGSIAVDVNRLCELCSPTIEEAFTVSETTEVLDWEILNRPGEAIDVVIAIPESELQVYSKWITLLMEQLINVLMQR